MGADMDIDMDLDIDPVEDDAMLVTPLAGADTQTQSGLINGSVSTVLSGSDVYQPTPHKVHLRGLDNLTSSDIKAYASEYFQGGQFEKIEWIDDTSANLVFATSEIALEALAAFVDSEANDVSQVEPLRMLSAKPIAARPETRLEVRMALLGDRKQAGARERSRFYLFNPEHDPAERTRREVHNRRGGRRHREREDKNYRQREDLDQFDVNLYDDDEASRAARKSKAYESRSSIRSGEYRENVRDTDKFGALIKRPAKELFPDRVSRHPREGSRLRDRSASPLRDGNDDQKKTYSERDRADLHTYNTNSSSSANRLQAQMIKAMLKETSLEQKELFPEKTSINHRRSDAIDATDAAADLFASRMHIPFLDGNNDGPLQGKDCISRITETKLEDRVSPANRGQENGITIRGTARQQQSSGINIRGTASIEASVKELFPHKNTHNSGKELFSEKLEGRGGRRRRAEDMFY